MAAVVAGNSLGLSSTSLHILGSAGKLGAAATGQAGEQVYVNAATGNLVVQNRDELVLGRGPDLNLVRTYNSRGLLNDDNGDNWRLGIYRRVFGLTGTVNTAGSTVTRVDADGAESVYTLDTTLGKYVCSEGEGAYDTLAFDSGTQTWTFTDGDSRVTERYDWANNGRITQVQDADGNGLTYTYNASGLITQVSDASGETTFLDYTGTNLTQLRTVKSGGQTLVRTRYAYDTSNRLIQVTTDLSPDDAAVADGNVYTVNYTYDGTSKRVASLTQTDGNNLSFAYTQVAPNDWRVASYTDANGKTTSISYTQGTAGAATTASANNAVLSTTETQSTSQTFNLNTAALTSAAGSGNKLQNWSTVSNISAATGTWTYYSIDVPAGQSELFVGTSGGTGDADLFVRYGAQPNGTTFDAKSVDSADANEAALIQNPAAGTWYIGVHAFSAISGVQLRTYYAAGTAGTRVLQPGTAVADLYGPAANERSFSFNVPAGTSSFKLALTGQAAQDVDLYLKFGTPPTASVSDFRSDGATANESIAVNAPQAGTWYALVRGHTHYNDAALVLHTNLGTNTPPTVQAGATQSVGSGAAVTLSAAGSDAQGAVSYQWTQIAGPAVTLANAASATASFTAPGVSSPTLLDFRVKVTDSQGATNTDVVHVIVASQGYTVKSGDDWPSIATALYGSSSVATPLQSALGNPPLTVGNVLTGFPATLTGTTTTTVTVPAYYTVSGTDSWTSITQTVYGTSDANAVAALQAATGNPTLTSGLHLTVPLTLNYSVPVATTVSADITDPLGQVTSLFYDGARRIVRALTPTVGGTRLETRYAYDASGNVTQVVDGKGNAVTFEYNANGNRSLERDAAGNTVKRTYGSKNELLTETSYLVPDPDGAGVGQPATPLTRRFVYDVENHLRFVVSAEGRVVEYRYSLTGEQEAAIQYTGNLYSLAGLNPGDALSETQLNIWVGAADKAKTLRTDSTYDFRGQLATTKTFASVDALGNGVVNGTEALRQYVYDQAGNLLKTVDPRGSATTDPNDFTTTYVYDGLGRVLSTVDALGRTTLTQYQDANRKTVLTFANGLVSTSTYDATGNLVSVLQSSNSVTLGETRYFYDANGSLRRTEDPTGIKTHILYDEAGRKIGEIDGDGSLTEYRYDAASNLTRTLRYATAVSAANLASLIAADGKPTTVALAAIRPVSSAADRSAWNAYDTANRLVKSVDEAGAVSQYFYDGAGRLTDVVRFATVIATGALGDTPAATSISPASNAADRLSRSFYDAEGRLRGSLDAEGYLVEYKYDAAGQLLETVGYATATAATLRATGTLAQLIPAANGSDIRSYLLYNARGQVAGAVDGEGYLTETVYDTAGNKTQVVRYATKVAYSAGATLASLRPAANAQDRPSTFAYDALNRVTSETNPEGTQTQYFYDEVGNLTRTVKAVGTADVRTLAAQYDKQGRLTAELSAKGAALLTGGQTQAQIDAIWAAHAIRHTYDAAGRRTSTTDAGGRKTLFYYNADGALTHTINAAGEVKESVYNTLGQVTQTIEYGTRISATALATLSGGLNSTLTGVTANVLLDSKASYAYTATGALAQKTDPLGNAVTQAFNAFGELASKTQALGGGQTLEHTYAYDRRGLLTLTRWDPTGINTSEATVYDAFGRATQTTDTRGNVRTQSYDRLGRVVTSTDPLNNTRSASYDAVDRVLTQTDALGKTTVYTYNTVENSITIRTPENISTKTVKNRHGETISVTDGRSNTTTYSYDLNGNLTGITAPAAGSVTSVYDNADRLIETTDALGSKTAYTYDTANRVLTRTVDSGAGRLNLVTTYAYDAKGQTVSVTDPAGMVTQTTFDLEGQVTQVAVDPAGLNLRTAYTYDGRGKTLTVTEGAGSAQPRVTQYAYDKLGRRTSERLDPGGINATTTYAYDKNDNVVRKTDARGNVIRYTYDANNRLVHTVDALGGVTKNDYDAEGRLARHTAYATRISLTGLTDASTLADVAGRLTATANDHTKGYVYDADGREIYCVDSLGGVTQKSYDANGNVVREVKYFNAISISTALTQAAVNTAILPNAANDRVTRTVYDAANRAAYAVDAEGYVTERRFDLAGHEIKRIRYADRYTVGDGATVAGMATLLPATVPATAVVEEARYDNAGRLFEVVDGLGNVTRNAYDAAGRKTDVTRAYGTSAASTTHYVYDAASRAFEETLGYGSAEAATTRYALDALGNRTKIIEARGVELAESDSAWALATRKALGYVDGLGNAKLTAALTSVEKDQLRARHTTTQQFDALGRRTRTTDALGGVSVTDYDAFGNAVKITDPRGNSGYFYFDALNQTVLHVDPEGYATQSYYDVFGNVERIVRYANKVTGTIATGTPPTITPNGTRDQTTVNEYDKLNRKFKVTDAENYYEQYVYDAFGNKLSYRNQLGGVTSYTYDRVGNVLSEALPVGGVVNRFEYDARGNRTKQIEASGLPESRTTTFEYDKLDREVKKIGQAVHVFDPVTFSTTGTGSPVEQKKYDARGNAIETIAASGARTLTYYDALDRKIAELGALGALTVWQYNDGKAPTAELRYGDPVALPAAAGGIPPAPVNAANVREKRFVYDANNALVETRVPSVLLGEQAAGASAFSSFIQDVVTKSVYDLAGNEVQAIDARGNSTFRYYDRLGQKILEVDPEKYLTSWQRDAAGNVVKETKYANKLSILPAVTSDPVALIANVGTNSADRVTELDYDRMNRVLERRVLNVEHGTVSGTGVLTPATGTARTQLRYNGLGQVTQQIDATGAVTDVGYDLAGRKIKEQGAQFTDFEGALVTPTTDYEYDALNQVRRELDRGKDNAVETDDRITTYQYDYGFGARLIGQTDPTGATVNFAYDLAGNIASRSRVRTNADSVSVTDRVNYSYDLLGRERLQKDIATSQTNETNYNVFGDLTGKRTNGGGLGAPWQEVAEFDKLGRVWKTNSGDGTYKVHLYDANGNSTLTIQSAGPDFSTLTLDQVMALAGTQKFLTVSQYDARNNLIGTYQPKMNSSHEFASIEQYITQTAGANFSGGAVSVGSLLQTTTKLKVDPVASGSAGVLKPGTVSASLTLRFTPGAENWFFDSSEGASWTRAATYTSPNHSFSLGLPDTSALGTGNVRIAFSLASVPGSGGGRSIPDPYYADQVNGYWESNLAGYSNSFFAANGTLNPTFTFGEFTTDGGAARFAGYNVNYSTNPGYEFADNASHSQAFQGAYYGAYSQGMVGRSYSYSLYKQTENGEIFLGSFSGRTQPASAVVNSPISAAGWNSGVGVLGREVDFRGQPGSQQGPATRLILQFRPTGSTGGWAITSVPQKLVNGVVAQGWFAFDWTPWAQGSYEVRYTTLDAAGNVTNSQSGTMVLSDSVPSFTQTTQQIGGVGRVFMASDGQLHILEQGSSAQTLTIRYRHAGSTEAWSAPAAVPQWAGTAGWFVFNPTGLTGAYEYWIEAKNASGAQVNKALGTFTVGNANSVSVLTGYQDLPEMVHFLSQPASAASVKLSYRASGSTGTYTTVWLTKVGTGAFDWDATSLVVDRLANYDYEYQYDTFDAANALVNKAHGVLRLGTSPAMLSHQNDSLPSIVSFSPPQTNATKLVLNYRNAGSTGAFTAVALTRASSGQPFTWDAATLGSVTLDYYYELFDSLNAPVRSADGNAVRVDGTLTLGATSEPTALKWVIVGGSNQEWSIHRTQTYNAFGDVAQEIDGLGRVTDFAYSKLGQLTEKRSPETDITLANGFVQRGRPTTRYAYDLAGRLVAVTDANGNVNTLQLLAGSGVNGEGAQALTEFHADGGRKLSAYDVFGDARTLTDEIGRVTRQEYDKLGRLIRLVRPARGANTPGNETAAAVSGVDSFTYDQIGNRITRTNAQSAVEKTYYDSLGRVVQSTSFSGDVTGYSYNYDAAILGAGAVQVGGWLKTITDGTGRALRDKQDVFGRVTWHQDLGDHQFTYSYNHAGWLTGQTGTSGQNIVYDYYANGYIKTIDDRATGALTKYEYDAEGNRTLETFSRDLGGGSREFYQSAQVTYDELNRVKRVLDPKADIRYEYDANNNRRRVWSYYHDGVDGSPRVQEYWYAYDSLNRFVVTMGQLSSGGARGASATDSTVSVVKGSTGVDLLYNASSERKVAIYGSDGHREDYTYTADGYLEDTTINGVLRARRFNDSLGRTVKYQEYSAAGAPSSGRVSSYDADSKLISQTEYNGAIGGAVASSTTYDYLDAAGTNNNAGPLASTVNTAGATTISTYYNYEWWDSAKERDITSQPYNVNAPGWKSGFSHFQYDVNGHLKQVDDVMGGRAIRFTTDAEGLVLIRDELSGGTANAQGQVTNAGTIDKHHSFYYLDGHRIGDVGNDGPLKVSYAEELARPRGVSLKDSYKNWRPISSADFDQNYEPIGPSYPAATPGLYTVRAGDTLRGIALAVWGDADLWYILADTNGLSGSTALVAGQTLTIPNKVTNIHNNSSTYRVYNAGEAIGDTSPTLPDAPPPPPPRGKKGCGGFGGILAAVIAVAVVVIVAPYAIQAVSSALTALGGGTAASVAGAAKVLGWAAAGAAGSMASQGFSIAAGMQEEFSWKAIATSAIGAGVGASFLPTSPSWTQIATAAAASSVVTQGLNVAVGLQQKFDWRSVAASFIAAPIGAYVGAALGGQLGDFMARAGRGLVGQVAQKAVGNRDHFDYASIAGNAIGESLADELTWDPLTAEDAYTGHAMRQLQGEQILATWDRDDAQYTMDAQAFNAHASSGSNLRVDPRRLQELGNGTPPYEWAASRDRGSPSVEEWTGDHIKFDRSGRRFEPSNFDEFLTDGRSVLARSNDSADADAYTQVAAGPAAMLNGAQAKTIIDGGTASAIGGGFRQHAPSPRDGIEELIPPENPRAGVPGLRLPDFELPTVEQLVPPQFRPLQLIGGYVAEALDKFSGLIFKAPADQLADAMLINEGIEKPANTQTHHMVPEADRRRGLQDLADDARAHLDRLGIGINESYNGVHLPRDVHAGLHNKEYYRAVVRRLEQAETREQGIQNLKGIREELSNGTFPGIRKK